MLVHIVLADLDAVVVLPVFLGPRLPCSSAVHSAFSAAGTSADRALLTSESTTRGVRLQWPPGTGTLVRPNGGGSDGLRTGGCGGAVGSTAVATGGAVVRVKREGAGVLSVVRVGDGVPAAGAGAAGEDAALPGERGRPRRRGGAGDVSSASESGATEASVEISMRGAR